MSDAIRVFDAPICTLGEGPVWDAALGALHSIDAAGRMMHRNDASGAPTGSWALPRLPGSYAHRAGGGILMAWRNGLGLIDPEAGRFEDIPGLPIDFARERFNDGACDRRGRFWAGTMDRGLREPVGALYRIDPDLTVHRMMEGITLSNGIAFSPDDRVMYHGDSRPGVVRAYDFDLETGRIANPRIHIDFTAGHGRPDGCTMDAEGCLWVAEVEAGRIVRFDPAGKRMREIAMPVAKPTSVMFGGAGLATLFVTSMRYGLTEEALAAQPLAGRIFALEPGVAGLPEPRFVG